MLGSATLPVYFAFAAPGRTAVRSCSACVMAAFIVYTHRSNVRRMRAGNENRARRLWLLRPSDERDGRAARAPARGRRVALRRAARRRTRRHARGGLEDRSASCATRGIEVAEPRTPRLPARRAGRVARRERRCAARRCRRGLALAGAVRSDVRTRLDQRVPARGRRAAAGRAATGLRRTADRGARPSRS